MLLSLILCSRNDSYMGNSKWRLETSINLTLLHAQEAGLLDQIEIIVSDWGSEKPLANVLSLISEAAGRVHFLNVSKEIAQKIQKDSKFPEVLALNAAARRASGDYIGRIDNDTVVGLEFFQKFFSLLKGKSDLLFDSQKAFLFVERRSVPYRFSCRSYSLKNVQLFLLIFGQKLKIESAREYGKPFWWSPVGIMLFHKNIWQECQGYDENLLYWGWMEGDLALRLKQKYQLVDFKDHVNNYFYHLEHYPSLISYKDRNGPATPRKKNKVVTQNLTFKANDSEWGLHSYKLVLQSYKIESVPNYKNPKLQKNYWPIYPFIIVKLGALLLLDFLQVEAWEKRNDVLARFKVTCGRIRKIIFN